MKRLYFWILGAAIVILFGLAMFFSSSPSSNILPDEKRVQNSLQPMQGLDDEKVSLAQNSTGLPLVLPEGFSISIFERSLPTARAMAFDSAGNLWVSQLSLGTISKLEIQDGQVVKSETVFRNLDNPHGLAFDPDDPGLLYIGEESRISKVRVDPPGVPERLVSLPSNQGHSTRTVRVGPDSRLYISIGSSCNVCAETDSRRAKIFSMNRDGSDFREYARGLRNTVFFTWSPADSRMWGTDNGRDFLGDNLPPDEINILEEGKDYGWPYCFGQSVHDDNFDSAKRVSCESKIPAKIDLQAHSAPLGLAFIPESSNWPAEYKNNLLVSFHGSWNRSVPTGYKVVRIKLDREGNYQGTEDFLTGWIQDNRILGRPVDILVGPDGTMFLSDDKAGVIYKVEYKG